MTEAEKNQKIADISARQFQLSEELKKLKDTIAVKRTPQVGDVYTCRSIGEIVLLTSDNRNVILQHGFTATNKVGSFGCMGHEDFARTTSDWVWLGNGVGAIRTALEHK